MKKKLFIVIFKIIFILLLLINPTNKIFAKKRDKDIIKPDINPERKLLLNEIKKYELYLSDIDIIYEIKPDVINGKEGKLKKSEKLKVLNYINLIRKLHDLDPVEYDFESDIYTSKAALILARNWKFTHFPPKNFKFWSEEGAFGCYTSNIGMHSAEMSSIGCIISYLGDAANIDQNNLVGHRMWILKPDLEFISFGRIYQINVLRVNFDEKFNWEENYIFQYEKIYKQKKHFDINYIAYPYKEYPSNLFDESCYLSFTPIIDDNEILKRLDQSEITVTIVDQNGNNILISEKKINSYYGLLNNTLIWKINNLSNNIKYNVTIQGIIINGEEKEFNYYFILM